MYYKQKSKGKNRRLFFILLLFLCLLILTILFVRKKDKRILFVSMGVDSVYVVNFDFTRKGILIIDIPKNTQVDVSYNLGQWELGSVWQLGEQEKIGGGRLLVSTVRKNFFIPVYLWMAPRDKIFVDGGPFFKFNYFVFLRNTNIDLFLRTKLAFVSTLGRMKVDRVRLTNSGMLKEVTLKTGQSGFLIDADLPVSLLSYLREPLFEEREVFVSVINESGNSIVVSKMSKVFDTMGARLISVENQNSSNIDCLVYSKDENIANVFASVFGCKKDKFAPFPLEINEVVIKIGKKFLVRW